MSGLPKAAWIPQIEVSSYNAGEAFVVVNNYRQNDWSAYLYHTTDYGNRWNRIVDNTDVKSFVTSVSQDIQEPNLLFLGTDAGLYISFDKGGKWTHWTNGLPPVQIRDMKIQKTFDDLVFGTFGRAFWVLDDIGPLRAYTRSKYTSKPFDIVSATNGYLTTNRSYQGIRFIGQAEFVGENKGTDVMMSVWIKPPKDKNLERKNLNKETTQKEKSKEKDKVNFSVLDQKGDTIRRFSEEIDKKGLVRMSWDLSTDGVKMPTRDEAKDDEDLPQGFNALPGKYRIRAKYGDHSDEVAVEVKLDPRVNEITTLDMENLKTAYDDFNESIKRAAQGFEKLKKAKKTIGLIEKLAETLEDSTKMEIVDLSKKQKDGVDELMDLFMDKPDLKGIQRNPKTLNRKISMARRYLRSSYGKPTPNAQISIDKANVKVDEVLEKVDSYLDGDWKKYRNRIEALDFELFEME